MCALLSILRWSLSQTQSHKLNCYEPLVIISASWSLVWRWPLQMSMSPYLHMLVLPVIVVSGAAGRVSPVSALNFKQILWCICKDRHRLNPSAQIAIKLVVLKTVRYNIFIISLVYIQPYYAPFLAYRKSTYLTYREPWYVIAAEEGIPRLWSAWLEVYN